MVYIKSILVGLAAVAGTAICIILAIAISVWWQVTNDDSGGVWHVFATGSTFIAAAIGTVALLIFALGFLWEFRRLAHSN
jgi:hypothetical protein